MSFDIWTTCNFLFRFKITKSEIWLRTQKSPNDASCYPHLLYNADIHVLKCLVCDYLCNKICMSLLYIKDVSWDAIAVAI